jgi:DNA-binding LacI/PurR family transcriptional regulator
MPKKVFDNLLRDIKRDIITTLKIGDHYLTLKGICAKFNVSYKAAQKVMKELARQGMIKTIQNSGSTVISLEPGSDFSNKSIAIVSTVSAQEFTKGFCRGIHDFSEKYGIQSKLITDIHPDFNSTTFGDFLLDLACDGVIALGFSQGAIGFCHAINKGLDIVSDTPLEEIPYLPSAYTDNFGHCKKAGERLKAHGFNKVLVVTNTNLSEESHRGFFKQRYLGLMAGLQGGNTAVTVVPLYEPRATYRIDAFMEQFAPDMAVFSLSTDSNFVVASKFYQHGIAVTSDNLLIYNSAEDTVSFYGLPDVQTIAPSRTRVGEALAKKLVKKWENGRFEEPLWEPV